MSNRRSSLYCAARPLVLSLIPVLTCTTAGAQSLYPGASEHYAKHTGYSGYAAPSYGNRPAWPSWPQHAPPYRSNFSAPNYAGRPAWAQTPVQSQYGTGTLQRRGGRPVGHHRSKAPPYMAAVFPLRTTTVVRLGPLGRRPPRNLHTALPSATTAPARLGRRRSRVPSVPSTGRPISAMASTAKAARAARPGARRNRHPSRPALPGGHAGDGGSTQHPPQTGAHTGQCR